MVVAQSQVVKIPESVPLPRLSFGLWRDHGRRRGCECRSVAPRSGRCGDWRRGCWPKRIQGARIAGARRIVAVDMSEEKLEIAKEFGATDGVLATGDTPWRDAKKAIGRGADAVFVTVGVSAVYDQAPAIWDMAARLLWWACQNRAKAPPMNP